MEHSLGLFRLFLLRPRRVLRAGDLYDGGADHALPVALPRDTAGGRRGRGAGGRRPGQCRLPRATGARRTVRAADACRHLRAGDDHPEHADRRRARRVARRCCRPAHRSDGVVIVLFAGTRDRGGDAGYCFRDLALQTRHRIVRDSRRRGRRGGARRAHFSLQARRLRDFLRAGGRGGRGAGAVHLVRDGSRDVFDHRSAHSGVDERARGYAALGRAGHWGNDHHRDQLRVGRRQLSARREGRRRRDPDRGDPVHAGRCAGHRARSARAPRLCRAGATRQGRGRKYDGQGAPGDRCGAPDGARA